MGGDAVSRRCSDPKATPQHCTHTWPAAPPVLHAPPRPAQRAALPSRARRREESQPGRKRAAPADGVAAERTAAARQAPAAAALQRRVRSVARETHEQQERCREPQERRGEKSRTQTASGAPPGATPAAIAPCIHAGSTAPRPRPAILWQAKGDCGPRSVGRPSLIRTVRLPLAVCKSAMERRNGNGSDFGRVLRAMPSSRSAVIGCVASISEAPIILPVPSTEQPKPRNPSSATLPSRVRSVLSKPAFRFRHQLYRCLANRQAARQQRVPSLAARRRLAPPQPSRSRPPSTRRQGASPRRPIASSRQGRSSSKSRSPPPPPPPQQQQKLTTSLERSRARRRRLQLPW